MDSDQKPHPEMDPAEGSREVVEKQLRRQDDPADKAEKSDPPKGGGKQGK